MSKAILTDITKCIGCLECVSGCKESNKLEMDLPREWQRNDGLSADNWTAILQKPGPHYVRKQCRHCLEPACATACPVGALHTTAEGAVVYDRDKCIGCRYCMMACPYGVPRYDWDEPVPYVRKCTMCHERLLEGKQPACTEACPNGATIFGERDDLLKEARKRIKEGNGKYLDHIWGESEVGGTSVMYISDINLDFLSYQPDPGRTPLPETTRLAMKSVPYAFAGMGGLMYGINWIVRRRMKLSGENQTSEDDHDE